MSQPLPLLADPAAFVADLRELRARAGAPSYACLARRTGLPRSTIYDGLHRSGLPPLELTLALVHAFDADEANWQARWTAVRCRLDASAATESPSPADSIRPQWYRRRFWSVTAVALVLVALTASALTFAFVGRHSTPGCQRSTMYRISAGGNLLDASHAVVLVLAPGDLFVVGERSNGPYAHRLFGTSESTGKQGYVDEAKLDRLRETCRAASR